LPPACRLVFNLYVFEGLKHREIARLLEISRRHIKINLFDARNILKKQLSREFKIAEIGKYEDSFQESYGQFIRECFNFTKRSLEGMCGKNIETNWTKRIKRRTGQ
jgi:hypothetical protein